VLAEEILQLVSAYLFYIKYEFLFSNSFYITSLLVFSLPISAQPQNNHELNEIIAGIPRSFPPQYFINEQGKPAGLAIDQIESIANKANLKIRFQVMNTWTEVYEALHQGTIHIVPNMGITEKRKEFTDFTDPVETFAISTFVRNDSTDINSFNDLSDRLVGVVEGNVGVTVAKNKKNIIIKHYKVFSDALLELISGRIDGIIYPEPVVWKLAQEVSLDHKIRVLSPPLLEVKRAIGVSKGQTHLYQRLQQTVKQFVQSNEYREIISKWYSKPIPYWTITRLLWVMSFIRSSSQLPICPMR